MRKKVISSIVKIHVLILLGGSLVVHWWWSALHPYVRSDLLEFFISHLLLVVGIWFLVQRIQYGRKVAIISGSFFVIYGFFMAALLIPGGFEEIGFFAIIFPVYLTFLGIVLGVRSFLLKEI